MFDQSDPSSKGADQSTMPSLLRDLKIGAVPHGFRSSFRDRAAECTDYLREICELALAHVNSDRVENSARAVPQRHTAINVLI